MPQDNATAADADLAYCNGFRNAVRLVLHIMDDVLPEGDQAQAAKTRLLISRMGYLLEHIDWEANMLRPEDIGADRLAFLREFKRRIKASKEWRFPVSKRKARVRKS